MKIDFKKLPRGQAEITIELAPNEYQPFLEQAAKQISETTKISGFRPGKANFEIIKQKVGLAEIWEKAIEPAVKKTLFKAINDNHLITIGSPQIEIIKLAPDNPVIYQAKISLLPEVELGDYQQIKVARKKIEVSEQEVQKALTNLQKMRAKEILVDRPAKSGDKVEIDFETFLDKIPVSQGKQQKFPLVIGENAFIPGFEDQLIGLTKNQTKEFSLKFPENYHQKNLAGRLVDFKVKLNAVYQLDLPELNDELAKSFGTSKTMAEFKNEIRQKLQTEAESRQARETENELIDKIIEQSKFTDIPDFLVDSETKKMVDELEYNLTAQGLKFEDYLNHLKKSRADLLLDLAPQAMKRVKSALVLRRVGKDKNIEVSNQEIDLEIKNTLAAYVGNSEIEKNLQQPAYRDYLKNVIASRKVLDYIKSVTVK
ncbi:MAG: trigger factor [Candidatus Buchananbacteria bacterium RIFCSPHIGHO2_01_FULL_39_14]|uniref:Trigger factor n=2 Tax=Candidatus Buchananiibacteriota TaxID=1817903 RepID=A0A1G1YSM7_9BACT|nr:MAG: trigger factor [Candidatus Buchananbacteria bacterium RIFCSPHIGHO2_01_FULL_39_14]OGY48456.1 MAG: trigger factor [Candidatus Buchananbacteria bacterium RIFCSPHIGHO2_02_FULL_39_17]OGY55304.1 MAG: trigger factor [Candidatus Buchananbacteria bacterium RIFCSPLOWO2_01_FULL_40_23b]